MKNKLFSIDIMRYHGKTTVQFWRDDGETKKVKVHDYIVETDTRAERLRRSIPTNRTTFISPDFESLSISIMW
jgi:hypothetical protein